MSYGLLRLDFEQILANVPYVQTAVPVREIRKEARLLDRTADVRLVGCTPEYAALTNLQLSRGRFITDSDSKRIQNVAVLGSEVADELFPYENPVGRFIQIDKDAYVIIGTTANRMPTSGIGGSFAAQDFNRDVYIPLETLRWRIGDAVFTTRGASREGEVVELSQFTLTVGSLDDVDATAEMVRGILEVNHPRRDFAITVPKDLLRQAEILQMMFNVLLVLIAGIALVVGGIGIMNIMLATVTERTREIGVRRALGAKRRDIITQFLSETIVLCVVGGLLGVLAGFACPWVVDGVRWGVKEFLPDVHASLPPNIRELAPRIAPWSIAVAFLISVGVGVLFGLYPARRAAMMDPIEALRHE
jgi:putative ABC transport system permease protein